MRTVRGGVHDEWLTGKRKKITKKKGIERTTEGRRGRFLCFLCCFSVCAGLKKFSGRGEECKMCKLIKIMFHFFSRCNKEESFFLLCFV